MMTTVKTFPARRRFYLAATGAVAVLATLVAVSPTRAQTTYNAGGISSTWAAETWNGVTGGGGTSTTYPGFSTRNNTSTKSTDIAQNSLTGAKTLDINFGTGTNGVGAQLTIGAYVYNPATGTTNTLLTGNNSGSAGTLNFTGVTLNGTSNVIISNTAAGAGTLTLQPRDGNGSADMSVGLASGTNTMVSGTGSGTSFGNAISITAAIGNGSTASSITFLGGGDGTNRGGTLTLGATNTFSGGLAVGNTDGSQAGRVRFSTAGAMPTTGNFAVNPNSQIRLDAAATYGATTQTMTLNSLGAAAGSATNISNGGLRYDPSTNGTATFNPTINLTGSSGIHVENAANTLNVAGGISGNGGLTKTGAGTLNVSSAGTYLGATTITGGTLSTAAANALQSTTAITVNTGGTLLLAGTGNIDRVNNAATITLAGGTLARGATAGSEGTGSSRLGTISAYPASTSSIGLGALTLTANSILDFGTGTVGTLTFSGLSFSANGLTLNVLNYDAGPTTVGTSVADGGNYDRLIFAQDQTGNLNRFAFNGAVGAQQIDLGGGYFEIVPVPVPEPTTVAAGLLALGTLGYSQRRRVRGFLAARRRTPLPVAA